MASLSHIGIDITDIERFRQISLDKNKRMCEKIFTPRELTYCLNTENPAPHLAVRFAAKEAVIKALSSAGIPPIELKEIEVLREKNGAPKIILHVPELKNIVMHISLSHAGQVAVAVAVIIDMPQKI
ncbi:MAG: holo-[acyl-carrier protein] synthase [Parcubacteria group bacterium Gr01-1014_66]|nr:MAG: holo-[acyl-carrier protein] synthase [Parcubacteria group bacterium Gr01-1014_66]